MESHSQKTHKDNQTGYFKMINNIERNNNNDH